MHSSLNTCRRNAVAGLSGDHGITNYVPSNEAPAQGPFDTYMRPLKESEYWGWTECLICHVMDSREKLTHHIQGAHTIAGRVHPVPLEAYMKPVKKSDVFGLTECLICHYTMSRARIVRHLRQDHTDLVPARKATMVHAEDEATQGQAHHMSKESAQTNQSPSGPYQVSAVQMDGTSEYWRTVL